MIDSSTIGVTPDNESAFTASAMRESASPARTIDSHDSTIDSLDTIVDRNSSSRRENEVENIIAQSINTTNTQQQHQHDSLTNSQASILRGGGMAAETEQLQQLDAQSHIYSSPVYDEKPPLQPLKLSAVSLVNSAAAAAAEDEGKKTKIITHEEFQKQLQDVVASRAATLDSRISKKQRFPPELIKIKDRMGSSSTLASKGRKQRRRSSRSSSACCSAFPLQIVLGTLQLALAISLVALGSLLLVREASLATSGCGIWTGLVAAITGSMGVVSIRKTQTAFLALSLVCVATSTLALAISGVGLSRDVNRLEQKLDLLNANSEISAACGLIFALFLHFVVSIVSVYRCALQVCSKSHNSEMQSAGITMDPEKMDQYIKALSMSGKETENPEKLAAMWMYSAQMGSMKPSPHKMNTQRKPIMLIPASAAGSTILTPPSPAPGMMLAPPSPMVLPPGMPPYRISTLPYMRPPSGTMIYAPPPGSMPGTFRTHKSTKSADINNQRRRRRAGVPPAMIKTGKMEANRRQRRKSEADMLDGQAFKYTGLDRAIADNFLARQEQSNAGSHVDYSSSSTSTGPSETYGSKVNASRPNSKTKIICRDVVM